MRQVSPDHHPATAGNMNIKNNSVKFLGNDSFATKDRHVTGFTIPLSSNYLQQTKNNNWNLEHKDTIPMCLA